MNDISETFLTKINVQPFHLRVQVSCLRVCVCVAEIEIDIKYDAFLVNKQQW